MLSRGLEKMTVLYVEDDRAALDVYSEELAKKVKEVFTAQNGVEGYAEYKKHQPDIVITDIMMPVLNGIEMAKKIRMDDEFIPIIITSSSQDKQHLEGTLEIGISGYMSKPVNFHHLEELLTSITVLLNIDDEKKAHEKILKERFNMYRLLV